jgi:hypothetical protein
MGEILGIKPTTVIAAAVVLGLAAVFISILLAGPSTIVDGAFSMIGQSVATAQVAMSGLLSSAGTIVAQGMSVATNAIAEFAMIASQAASAAFSIAASIFDVAASAVAAGTTIVASVIAFAGQVVASTAAAAAQMIIQFGAAYFTIKGTIEECRIYIYQVAAQNAIMALSQAVQAVFLSIAQIFTTMFTSLAGAAGQLLSIPMIMIFGYVSIGSAFITIVPGVIGSLISVFTTLFGKIVGFFIGTGEGTFLGAVQSIPVKLGNAIKDGFERTIGALPNALLSAFTGG